ncbi:MAG: hypothetical protein WAU39_21385 [Polyangiales bacterium]
MTICFPGLDNPHHELAVRLDQRLSLHGIAVIVCGDYALFKGEIVTVVGTCLGVELNTNPFALGQRLTAALSGVVPAAVARLAADDEQQRQQHEPERSRLPADHDDLLLKPLPRYTL